MTHREPLALLVACLSGVTTAPAQDPCSPDAAPCGKAAAAFAGLNAIADRPIPGTDDDFLTRGADDDTDLLHCNLEIELFPPTATLSGNNTMTVRSLVDGLAQFTFRLRSNLTISAITLNGTTSIPPASVQPVGNYGRQVNLDRIYNRDEIFTLRIDYGGAPVSLGFGSLVFSQQGGAPLVYSLSEPYYAGTWWPVKDGDALDPGDNLDKFTIDTAIIAPAALTSVSNGLLVGIDDLGTRRRFRWSTNYPTASYLVFFSTTAYNTWSSEYAYPGGTMPVEFAIFSAADSPSNRAAWERCIVMLETYRPIFGEYPFIDEKYGIYHFGFGGGMEHQTYTGQGTFSERVTSHELGHQWWGDNVTCRTWHDTWLNEGFATYTEALWLERMPGSSGFPAYHSAMNSRRPSTVGDSVYVYDTTSVGRIFSSDFTYRKGAWVLHMLRHIVGDSTFFQILADYRATFQQSAATTDEFAAVAAATSGRDLNAFFQQWVYLPGAPTYEYGWRNITVAGSRYVQLFIHQVQSATYPVFAMPIDVRVNRPGGSIATLVQNFAAIQHYLIPVTASATGVVLDEWDWILIEGKTNVSYVDGPPKVVSVAPAINAQLALAASPVQAVVQFSEPVTASIDDFSVAGLEGAVPFTLEYDSATYRAVLAFDGALPAGRYSVTVHSTLRSSAAGQELDGEITSAPNGLPSGDGIPGGDAVWTFHVRPPCPTDLNGDSNIDLADLAVLLSNFGTTSGASPDQGDLNSDEAVDLADLAIFLATFGTACP
jgi:aminopeptidase N